MTGGLSLTLSKRQPVLARPKPLRTAVGKNFQEKSFPEDVDGYPSRSAPVAHRKSLKALQI